MGDTLYRLLPPLKPADAQVFLSDWYADVTWYFDSVLWWDAATWRLYERIDALSDSSDFDERVASLLQAVDSYVGARSSVSQKKVKQLVPHDLVGGPLQHCQATFSSNEVLAVVRLGVDHPSFFLPKNENVLPDN